MSTVTVLNPNLLETRVVKLPEDYISLPNGYQPKSHRFVGLLACQMNPLLRSFSSIITRIDKKEVVPDSTKGSKSRKTDKKAIDSVPLEVEWEIELEDTVLFPEGGGQPCDHGTLTLQGSNFPNHQNVNVSEVFRRALDAVHVVKFPVNADPKTFGWVVGAAVHMEVDWDRRTYHMQQHTGQHLLSAILEHELKNDTLGWMLSQNSQPSYVDLQRSPSSDDIAYVMRRCNEVIQAGTRVRVDVRLDSEHERPGTLPEDYRDGVIRYIILEDIDVNPCCGTHHPSLASLGSVFIYPGVTNISGPTRYRIYFAVGGAVLQHLTSAHSLVKDAGTALDCGPADIRERLASVLKARKDGLKREKVLKGEATKALAMELSASIRDSNGVQVGQLHREEESTDIEFLTMVLNTFQPPEGKWLVSLSSGPFMASAGSGGCLLLAGSDEALVKRAGELVKVKFNGRVKGGGKSRWQGKVFGNWQKGDQALLTDITREATM